MDAARYLAVVLNANAPQNAWQESRTACLHFDKNPLAARAGPRYDAGNAAHAELAKLGAAAPRTLGTDSAALRRESTSW